MAIESKSKYDARIAIGTNCNGGRLGVNGNWSADPMLLERLEARVAATDDLAVRMVFATYLSEP